MRSLVLLCWAPWWVQCRSSRGGCRLPRSRDICCRCTSTAFRSYLEGVYGVDCDRAPCAIAAPVSRGVRAILPDVCGDFFEIVVSSWPRLGLCLECRCRGTLASPLCALRRYVGLHIRSNHPATTMVTSQTHGSTSQNVAAESFTSSTRPINTEQRPSVEDHSTIATMSDINGKAPLNGAGAHSPQRAVDEPVIKVQPPRREDLQPSYARVIKPDDADADTNGWYGSMVSSSLDLRHSASINTNKDQYSRWMHRYTRRYSMLHRMPQPIQAS